jgi:hypothetical protein
VRFVLKKKQFPMHHLRVVLCELILAFFLSTFVAPLPLPTKPIRWFVFFEPVFSVFSFFRPCVVSSLPLPFCEWPQRLPPVNPKCDPNDFQRTRRPEGLNSVWVTVIVPEW